MASMRRVCDASERFLPKGDGAFGCCPVCGGGLYDFVDSRTVVPGDSALGEEGDLACFKDGLGAGAFELGGFVASFHCRSGCRFALAASWSQGGTELAWFADGDALLPKVSMSGRQTGVIESYCRKSGVNPPWSCFPGEHPEQFYDIADAKAFIDAFKNGKPLPAGGRSPAFGMYPPASGGSAAGEEREVRECAKCHRSLPLSEFNTLHKYTTALMRVCRTCQEENAAEAALRREAAAAAGSRPAPEPAAGPVTEAVSASAPDAAAPAPSEKPSEPVSSVSSRGRAAGGAAAACHPLAPVLSSMALTSEARAAIGASGVDTLEALSGYSRSKASKELHLGPGTVRRLSVEMAKVGLSFAG